MKQIALLLCAALALAGLITTCGGADNSPTGVVQHMVKTFEKGDNHNWKQSFCDPGLADLMLLSRQDAVDVSFVDTSYKEQNKSGSSAQVAFRGTVKSDSDGAKVSTDLAWTVDVEKQHGDWCITGIAGLDF